MQLFTIHTPSVQAIPIIANLPHSGLYIPNDIATMMTVSHLQSLPNSDWHLDKLYDFLPSLGITVMQANYSRYVVDLNRQAKEPLSGSFWSAVVPLQTAFGQPIYHTTLSPYQVQERVDKYYTPYHNRLNQLIEAKVSEFGKVYLLDLHSFGGLIDDQVCLGNVNGKTCSENFISGAELAFIRQEYQVAKNKTFTGGYITKNYSRNKSVETLQIEIRYQIYLSEQDIDKPVIPQWDVTKFYMAKEKLRQVFIDITHHM
jgi:N-formylglutamate deformylase